MTATCSRSSDSTRSMRRLKPDPVPDKAIERIIAAGTKAPSGQNTQPWAFLVLRDAAAKRFVQQRYLAVMERAMGDSRPSPEDRSRSARGIRAAWHLAEHLHEAPVLLLVCGKRDWPFAIAPEDRRGLAPPSYGSTFPAVQNILLACRGARTRRHADHPAPDVRSRIVRTFRHSGHPRRGGAYPHRLSPRPLRSGPAAAGTGVDASRSLGQPVAGLTPARDKSKRFVQVARPAVAGISAASSSSKL